MSRRVPRRGLRPLLRRRLADPRDAALRRAARRRRRHVRGGPGRAGDRRRQDAHRHVPGLPPRPDRQGRPRRHRQRLPGQARRRAAWARSTGCSACPSASSSRRWRTPTASAAYRMRHHLRHGVRVRLRLPARPAEACAAGRSPATPFWGPWTSRPGLSAGRPTGPARPLLRPGGRGRQHLHRRGPDAAHHQRPDPRGRRPRSASCTTGPTTSPSRCSTDEHFTLDVKKEKIELTEAGRQLARYSNPPSGPHAHAMDKLIEAIEKALQAHHRFVLDQHYMIHENKVVIVDESTGRPMPDRHWREGLHQAVEAKEKVPIHVAADHAASDHLPELLPAVQEAGRDDRHGRARTRRRSAGSTSCGSCRSRPTGRSSASSCRTGCSRPRTPSSTPSSQEIKQLREAGRPVLIGTRSVEKSEAVSSAADGRWASRTRC